MTNKEKWHVRTTKEFINLETIHKNSGDFAPTILPTQKVKKSIFDPKIREVVGHIGVILTDFQSSFHSIINI